MAEWSKAPDSRHVPYSLVGSSDGYSGPRLRAGVQIPFLTDFFASVDFNPGMYGIFIRSLNIFKLQYRAKCQDMEPIIAVPCITEQYIYNIII